MQKPLQFFSVILFFTYTVSAQEVNTVQAHINTKKPKKWDTTCYISYSHKLNVHAGYSYLNYNFDISTKFQHSYKYSTDIKYTTYVPLNYSAGFSYDKISLSIGFAQKYDYDTTQSKPKTAFKAFNFSFGGNNFIIEPYYAKFKGFYDNNTPNNDTNLYKNYARYHADPSMEIISFKVNGLYFFNNKRFAYRALSGYTYRQIKSKGSWIAIANAYYTRVSSDSILYPKSVELAYDSVKKLNSFTIYGANIGGGYGYTFAFGKKKRFFIGLTAALMAGYQKREIHFKDSNTVHDVKLSPGFDFRVSTGWTTDKFFLVIYSSFDRIYMQYQKVTYATYIKPASVAIGFRFNVKPSKLYRQFMNTKLYDWL